MASRSACVVLTLLAVAAGVCGQPAPLQPVPGINIGIGHSFDATKITVMGLTINPLQPVIQLSYCDPACLTPQNASLPQCLYCTYSLPGNPDMVYKVPKETFVAPYTSSSSCYEQQTSATVDDYTHMVQKTTSGGGWFHSWSKTTTTFFHEYFLKDSSLSLMYNAYAWHSITLPTFLAQPNMLFTIGAESLPHVYDNATYQEFIQQYGTHYMDTAQVGGLALMTNYFHSCFLEQYGGKYVYEQSSSSFFFASGGSASKHGFNKTSSEFKQWSSVNVKLLGGDAAKYGTINRTHVLSPAQSQEWADSIKNNMAIVQFTLQPLSTLIKDPIVATNFDHALAVYGATIKTDTENLVKQLVPRDPKTVPKWCHYGPHPPADQTPPIDSAVPAPTSTSLPGCPSLPTFTDEEARAEALRRKLI